jgi:hypothetical protein
MATTNSLINLQSLCLFLVPCCSNIFDFFKYMGADVNAMCTANHSPAHFLSIGRIHTPQSHARINDDNPPTSPTPTTPLEMGYDSMGCWDFDNVEKVAVALLSKENRIPLPHFFNPTTMCKQDKIYLMSASSLCLCGLWYCLKIKQILTQI